LPSPISRQKRLYMISRASILVRYGVLALGLTIGFIGVATGASLYPARVNFGNSPQTVTVTNPGSSTLHLGQIEIVGANAKDFSRTTTCNTTLAAGADCAISISFAPTASGVRTAALLLPEDGGGSPQMVSLTGTGQFMTLDPTKTYLFNTFTHMPVFITGEQAFELALNLASNSDIDLYLSTRHSQGFNFIWMGATDRAYVLNYPDNALGDPPFTDMSAPFRGMKEAYFAHLDYVIQRAAAYGMEVLLNVAFVGSGPTYCFDSTGWCLELQAASTSDLKAFGAYLGSRYKNFPNIIWMLGGDLDLTDYPTLRDKMQAILDGIKSTDKNHLVTVENEPPHAASSQDLWPAHTWDLNFFYHDPPDMAKDTNAAYSRSDSLPIFLGEGKVDNEKGASDLILRTQNYQAVLGGSTLGFVYASSIIWPFGFNPTNVGLQKLPGQTWQNQLTAPGSIASEHLGQLMRSREFWKMVPDVSHTVVTEGYGSGDQITVTARSRDGLTIISYIPNGNAATLQVDMSKISSARGKAKGWWFNPKTGVATLISTFANSGLRSFTPPDSDDWVLVIDAEDNDLAAPGSADL
jgi:hypothetical protein